MEIQENVSLAPFTTLGVGGPAKYFVEAETETALVSALSFAKERELSVFILGGGSNVLVADEGFDGIVIHIRIDRSEFRQTAAAYPNESDRTNSIRTIRAGAGENWDDFVRSCVENDLAGVECLSGIPGYIGGTPVQNVGAYGQEVSETI
ncbi:MAG: FAD-binding protein, partial [Blastocatellia bacterium]|nr:FAD-binding protein [Blastocatellia bacterium]